MPQPTGYTFPLAGGALGGTAQSSTGATRPYAYCRQLDPKTGDVLMNGATWKASPTPMLEVVLRVLRTPLGRYVPNANFGVDYGILQSLLPTTGSAWRAEVLRALKTYVDLNLISSPSVQWTSQKMVWHTKSRSMTSAQINA
jgi:phage baseplate assembly protein W